MEKLQFNIQINTSAEKIYRLMLGLDSKSSYEFWVSVFNPTSTYEGSWNKGSKICFIGTDENGKRRGMVSEVLENIPTEFVSIRHNGFIDGKDEITTGELVEKWAGGLENYRFVEIQGITTVTVDIDVISEYVDYFNQHYPIALGKLKEIAEQ